MGRRGASLAILAFKQEDSVASDLWQVHVVEHANIVPLLCVFGVKCCILVTVREDYCAVQRINVLDGCLPDAQDFLIASLGPVARLEE